MHLEIPPEMWVCHETADVAVLPLALNMNTFDYLYYPIRNGATAEFIKRHSVTPGEAVFITGLLISHPGKSRVLPIVRVGNIAAFPADPINLLTGHDSAYLVEVRSLGGLGGSPAFVPRDHRERDRDRRKNLPHGPRPRLLSHDRERP
jgi:hypothetical protein